MHKLCTLLIGLGLIVGCGSEYARSDYPFSVGIYAGTVVLVSGSTPACSVVLDPTTQSCCDDTQAIALSVSQYPDGYYVDGWAASVDATGGLYWQQTLSATSGTCSIGGATEEYLSQQLVYDYQAVTTQTCATSVETIQCAYAGQLFYQ